MRRFGRRLMGMPDFTPGFNRHAARQIKARTKTPVFVLGGMHDPREMAETVEKGDADYVSLCRPLIADPAFPLKIRRGDTSLSRCTRCNYCFFYTVMKEPLRCWNGKRIGGNS
jgi:2,4-dienoyl-CoA reductase-like NADH-dependent reductase (Old Yellow Enzyme family)